MITAQTRNIIIIGDPVHHSLSPAMHHAAYRHLGIEGQYVYTACEVKKEHLGEVIVGFRHAGIHGITCTMPHKVAVMPYLDVIDEAAREIGAVNTIVNRNGQLHGYNTDWLGIYTPVQKLLAASPKLQAVVLGSGGAASAALYAMKQLGIAVTQLTGSEIRAGDYTKVEQSHRIVFNATPVGMAPQVALSPFPSRYMHPDMIVFDSIYHPRETQLLRDARNVGATTIAGWEMLLHQGTAQFEIYTGRKAPVDVMRECLV